MKHLTSIKLGIIALLTPFAQETFASENGCPEITALCEHKISDEAIIRAAGDRNLDLVKKLLEQGVDPDSRNEGNMTALMKAGSNGYLNIVKLLLEHGANPNTQSNSGKTPLIRTVKDGMKKYGDGLSLSIVSQLSKYGVDFNTQDKEGNTALMYATKRAWTSFVDLLIKKGADVNVLNYKDENALTYLLNHADEHDRWDPTSLYANEMLHAKTLIENGIDFNQADASGETALMKLHKMGKHDLLSLCYSMQQDAHLDQASEATSSNEVDEPEQPNWQETLTREAFSLEIAQKMLDKGFTVADIAEITGLEESEVTSLQ